MVRRYCSPHRARLDPRLLDRRGHLVGRRDCVRRRVHVPSRCDVPGLGGTDASGAHGSRGAQGPRALRPQARRQVRTRDARPRSGRRHRRGSGSDGAERITRKRHVTMSKPFKGVINIDVRDSTPDWAPYEQPKAPDGAPNVLVIVWDDTGFGALSPYGGPIECPTMDRLAAKGLRYTQFHTTAMCSPTRASLLTGRNHTTVGMACVAEATTGFPGSNGHIPPETATIAEVLGECGYNTYMVGKWHCCPEDETNMASSKRNWPTGRGFERFYGFLGGETNQWFPDLVQDQQFLEQPYGPEDGYHLSKDLTDRAIAMIADAKQVAPDRPFFMYFCPGANHAPHHAPKEWADKYKGRFDMGYEKIREEILERQKHLGIVPENTELSPLNPYVDETGAEGTGWPQSDIQ